MVDEPQFTMPQQHIGIQGRAVDICQKGIQPHYFRSLERVGLVYGHIPRHGSAEKMQPQVKPRRSLQQVLNFLVRLGTAKILVNIEKHKFGHAQTCPARHLATDILGYESLRTMAAATELHNVFKTVVSLGQRR